MLEIGQILQDKYRIDRLVGKGGMGQVFEGFHLLIHRRVAIKVLLPELAASEDGNARFASEVRAAARINNPHILDVFDAGALPDGSRFMVSEFLDGEPLETRLERGPLSAKQTALIVLELLDGLAAAHHAGIAHRDLKPDNVFLCRKARRDDFVKIIDFGISKFDPGDGQPMRVTTTGVVIGTPQYFSPEQARGERTIDRRSDLYAVGALMYRCVAGRVPFEADTVHALLFKIALQNAPPLAQLVPGLDLDFSLLTEKAMAKDPGARFQSAEEMSHAIKTWLSGSQHASAPPAGAEPRRDTLRLTPASAGSAPTDSTGLAALEARLTSPSRTRPMTTILVLGVGVALAAGALLTLRRPSAPPPAAPSAEPTSPHASIPSAQPPQLEPSSEPPVASSSPPSASDAASAQSSSPPRDVGAPPRKPQKARSHATEAPRPQPTVSPPAPKPSATVHPRRDFGY